MKIFLLWVVVLLPLWGVAQTTVTANRVVIKDSLSLNGKWINRFNTDSAPETNSVQTISSDAVLKKYIDRVAGGGISTTELSKMMKNPDVLEVKVSLWTKARVAPSLNFTLNFLSSDGIKSTCNVYGKYSIDYFTVYGKPPFSLYAAIPNATSDSTLSVSVASQERPTSTGAFQNYANYVLFKPGDTAIITADQLRGNVLIYVKAGVRTSLDNSLIYINEKITNRSSTQSIYVSKPNSGTLALMPGQEISQRHLLQIRSGYGSYNISAATFFKAPGGEYLASYPNSKALRCKVYRNGVLKSTKDLSAFMDDNFSIPLDATWTDCEIIVEDI
ncbi:hypothetical protein CLV59_109160 [Chitinophaga dinghuensis]|uniref:IgGFc-binding protein N-terminal domain-containing protein n=1 Tax=Chitinophaga dinghuensis TaxID=1539050 RepID=A0A327VP53_9BACT|nr:hypothetical protein [Chitinophaga dinghuensis]RAJ75546.1 hypothetical protein CLV59_109160 [Chitinophaga dinghuensis]